MHLLDLAGRRIPRLFSRSIYVYMQVRPDNPDVVDTLPWDGEAVPVLTAGELRV